MAIDRLAMSTSLTSISQIFLSIKSRLLSISLILDLWCFRAQINFFDENLSYSGKLSSDNTFEREKGSRIFN